MGRPWLVTLGRRKAAVAACDQMASSNTADGVGPACEIEKNVSAKPDVIVLAKAAFDAVFGISNGLPAGCGYDTIREGWAEAAQILREGWIPGMKLLSMQEALEERIRARDRIAPPDAKSPEEAKLDLLVEEKHDKMNELLVPPDVETCNMRTHEVRKIDDGPVEALEEEIVNELVVAGADPDTAIEMAKEAASCSPPGESTTFEDEVQNDPTMEEAVYTYTEPEDVGSPVSKQSTDG